MVSRFQNLNLAPQPVAPVTVPFGAWLPDLSEAGNPGAVEALNVLPGAGGYVPFRDLVQANNLVLPEQALGGVELFTRLGQPTLYAGTSMGLYMKDVGGFDHRYTPTTTLSTEEYWQFVQFGNSVVALHPEQVPVVADVGGGADFTPLAGSPPIARCGARVGDFLVLGNLDNEPDVTSARQPSRIRWSGFNNIEADWITDPATQADFNDMPQECGDVMAICGREYGTVFQERGISRMSYVGLPTVFDIELVEESRGAICQGCVVDLGALVYFIAEDGFQVWNGTNSAPIADNEVNTYFFTKLNYSQRHLIVSAIDYANKCIVWAFPTIGTQLAELIIYSYKDDRFSHSNRAVEWLMSGYVFDVSLDDLTGTLDTDYVESFDSGIYRGRKPTLAGFNTDHEFGFFNGPNMAASIDTAESSGPDENRLFVNSARPLVDVAEPVASIMPIYRDQLRGGALVFGAAAVQEITGECSIIEDARYMRFRTLLPYGATWTKALGVEVYRKATGRR